MFQMGRMRMRLPSADMPAMFVRWMRVPGHGLSSLPVL